MQIVIDIPEQIYKELIQTAIIVTEVYPSTIERALTEGIVLPKGHGRLVDADAIWDLYHDYEYDFYEAFNDVPTIIRADEEVDE